MSCRLTHATLDRARESAARHGIALIDLMGRADRAFRRCGRVADLPNRETATRNNSQAVRVPVGVDAAQFGQVLNWYLDRYDKGGRAVGMVPDVDYCPRPDGTIAVPEIVARRWCRQEACRA